MDAYELFNTFVTAAARDADLAAWSLAAFGRPINVYADLESASLPQASDMPYLIFHSPGIERHQDRREQTAAIAVDLALDKSALASRAETNVAEPTGLALVLELGKLLVAAIAAALPDNTSFGYTLAADTLGALPEVHGLMDLNFTTYVTIAGDPLA